MTTKIKKFNPKRKAFEDDKEKTLNPIEKAAHEKFKDLDYGKEWRNVFFLTSTLGFVCSICSMITLYIAFSWALCPVIGDIFGCILSGVAAFSLEALKGFLWGKTAKERLKYTNPALELGSVALLLTVVGFCGSLFGAYQLPYMASNLETIKPYQINSDSIEKSYKLQFLALNTSIEQTQSEIKKTTSNTTKRSFNNTIKGYQKRLGDLASEKRAALKRAFEENEKQAIKADKENAQNLETFNRANDNKQKNFVGAALLIELILICCLGFNNYYQYRVDYNLDVKETTPVPSGTTTVPSGTTTVPSGTTPVPSGTTPVPKRQIGFYNNHEASTTPVPIPRAASTTPVPQFDKKGGLIPSYDDNGKLILFYDNKGKLIPCYSPNGVLLNYTRICINPRCKKKFIHNNSTHKYCEKKCKRKAWDKKNKGGLSNEK